MNWMTIEKIAENPDKQMYYNQSEVTKIQGFDRHQAAYFLAEQSVPFYRLRRAKVYFLPEVLEAVEGTKWSR